MSAMWLGRAVNLACVVALLSVGLLLASGKLGLVRVAGGSMAPALWPGDLCLVTEVARPAVSDIVLLTEPGHRSRVLHRVRSVESTNLVTKGDANPVADRDPVPRSAVLGRVAAVVPIGGLLHRWQAARGE